MPTPSSGLPASSGGQPSSARADRLLAQRVLLALLRVGFTEPPQSPGVLVVSYTTVSPLPALRRVGAVGGLFSVALSRELPRVGVAHHPARWSPDLPRYVVGTTQRGRPAGLSAYQPSPKRERGAQRRAKGGATKAQPRGRALDLSAGHRLEAHHAGGDVGLGEREDGVFVLTCAAPPRPWSARARAASRGPTPAAPAGAAGSWSRRRTASPPVRLTVDATAGSTNAAMSAMA